MAQLFPRVRDGQNAKIFSRGWRSYLGFTVLSPQIFQSGHANKNTESNPFEGQTHMFTTSLLGKRCDVGEEPSADDTTRKCGDACATDLTRSKNHATVTILC